MIDAGQEQTDIIVNSVTKKRQVHLRAGLPFIWG